MEGTVLRQPLEIMDLDQMVCPNLKGLDEVKVFSAMFPDPNKQGGSWKNSFMHILDQFAKCLHEECQEGLTGWMRNVGLHCMFLIPFVDKCMLIDWGKVQREASKGGYLMFKSHKGRNANNKRKRSPPYLEVKIGKGERHPPPRSKCKEIMISAHRVLCFVRHGQPPHGKEIVLHTCEQSHCLNPLHLKWGDSKENSSHLSNTSKADSRSVNHTISQPTQPLSLGSSQKSTNVVHQKSASQ